jgi:hypothetical protein
VSPAQEYRRLRRAWLASGLLRADGKQYGAYLDAAGFDALVRAQLPDAAGTPAAWVQAAKALTAPCYRCGTTGIFARCWENGAPKGGGTCYRCNGTGLQGLADIERNAIYDRHAFAEACRAMVG